MVAQNSGLSVVEMGITKRSGNENVVGFVGGSNINMPYYMI